jgi:hypothetical protein
MSVVLVRVCCRSVVGKAISSFETLSGAVEQQANEANKRADVAVALADRTLVQLAEIEERADALKERLETMQAETREVCQHAGEAEDAMEAMGRADEARKARSR